MFEKILTLIKDKIGLLSTMIMLLLSFVLTIIEVKYFNIINQEEIITAFLLTLFILFFIFLLVTKIINLNKQTSDPLPVIKED